MQADFGQLNFAPTSRIPGGWGYKRQVRVLSQLLGLSTINAPKAAPDIRKSGHLLYVY